MYNFYMFHTTLQYIIASYNIFDQLAKTKEGSSYSEVSCRIGVLKNFAKYEGSILHWSLFFSVTLLKKRLITDVV